MLILCLVDVSCLLLNTDPSYTMSFAAEIDVSCLLPSAAALCLLSSCCFFFAKSPLSSPLLCFADDEIVQVHTLYGI